jgi:hypothetical protein
MLQRRMKHVKAASQVVACNRLEYAMCAEDVYGIMEFTEKVKKCANGFIFHNPQIETAFREIVSIICTPEFRETFDFSNKAGIILLQAGYPILSLEYRLAKLLTNHYREVVIIDIDNYIFSKKIETKVRFLKNYQEDTHANRRCKIIGLGFAFTALIVLVNYLQRG